MRRKGFTLIELMIVISVVGILTAVVVPKLGFMKENTKYDVLESNVLAVKNFLNSRKTVDGNKIFINSTLKTPLSTEEMLLGIKTDIGTSMQNSFIDSRALENPFSYNKSIMCNLAALDSLLSSNTDGSVAVVYDAVKVAPTDETKVTYPSGYNYSNNKGKVVVILHVDGYEGYGLGKDGDKVDPFVIKFPVSGDFTLSTNIIPAPPPPPAQNPLDTNMHEILTYLQQRVVYDVPYANAVHGGGNNEMELMNHLKTVAVNSSTVPDIFIEYSGSSSMINPVSLGSGILYIDTNGGNIAVPASTSIVLFKKAGFFNTSDFNKYKGMICIIPYTSRGNTVLGYEVDIIDQNGKLYSKQYIT